jgi:hypothetical protein
MGRSANPIFLIFTGLLLTMVTTTGVAQEVRYSWVEISYMAQDIGKSGSQITRDSNGVPIPGQIVVVDTDDGAGVVFRGSVGTWKNLYLFLDYSSTDIDLEGAIINNQPGSPFPIEDEFDYTTVRGGLGFKLSVGFSTDLYAEVSYDDVDFDFGSFAGESFDTDNQDVGGAVGVRAMLTDNFELRAHSRFTNSGDVDLSTGEFDTDTLFGAGFGWQIVRGLSIVADYETGEFSSWSIGFRLDMDED